uniref:Uncharacterized protein n=1 Tax=Arion vulgaris TaxID=1028688 RepID=A0A0B6YU46_9EUPU
MMAYSSHFCDIHCEKLPYLLVLRSSSATIPVCVKNSLVHLRSSFEVLCLLTRFLMLLSLGHSCKMCFMDCFVAPQMQYTETHLMDVL